jgi:hypothetical protein
VRALDSRRTTTYRNDYTGPVDRHELIAASDPIGGRDIPADWRNSDLTHLGPLHRLDLKPDVSRFVGGLVGLDLQGLVREARESRVKPNPDLMLFLEGVRVVHASADEIEAVLDGDSLNGFVKRHSIPEMIVTRGAHGALLIAGGQSIEVPARPARSGHVAGAGDVFLATYLFLRVEGLRPADAATGAAEVCSVRIERGEIPKGFRAQDVAS